jgi:hypothetical protein
MENKSMYEVVMNDFKQVYSFEVKGDEVVGPKIKFPVYDRVQAFNTTEAFYNGWTYYGIMQLILGKLKKEECWFHPAIHEERVSLKPSEEFERWLDEHHTLGPVLIMLALAYGDYELEG